jgi:predicted nucleic acid-binding protein
MTDGDFLDSNVFIYLVDPNNAAKRRIAEDLIFAAVASGSATISFQVVQETLNVMTRGLRTVVTVDDARRFLAEVLVPLWRVMPTRALYERALDVHGRYGYSFYDSLIIAAALQAGCARLYSEDLQHGQRIEGLTIENPFTAVA